MRRIEKLLKNPIIKNRIIRHIAHHNCLTDYQSKITVNNFGRDTISMHEKTLTRVCEAYKAITEDERSIVDISIYLLEEVE